MINLALDTSKQNQLNPTVLLRVGDGGVDTIHAVITDNGELMDLTGYTAEFRGMNAGGKLVVDSHVTVKGNEITWTMPSAAASVAGKYERAYFTFKKSGAVTSTANMRLEVFSDVDMTAEEAKPYIGEYDRLVNQLQSDFDAATKSLTDTVDKFTTSAGEVIEGAASSATSTADSAAAYSKSQTNSAVGEVKSQTDSAIADTRGQVASATSQAVSTADSAAAYAKDQTVETLAGMQSQVDSMGALAQSNADLSNAMAANSQFVSKSEVASAASQATSYTDAGLKAKADASAVVLNSSGYGAENLVKNSGYPTGTEGWVTGGAGFDNSDSAFRVGTHVFYHNAMDTVFQIWNASQSDGAYVYTADYFSVTPGEKIAWQFKAFAGTNIKGVNARIAYNNTNQDILTNAHPNPSAVEQFSGVNVVPAGATSAHFTITNSGTTNDKGALLAFTEIKIAHELQISPWNQSAFAGGIMKGKLNTTQQFYRYNSTSRDGAIVWSKMGNIVTLNGAVTPVTTLPGSATPVCIAKWPIELGTPYPNTFFICQGTGVAIWQLEIATDGSINFSRHRVNDASGTFSSCTPGNWLPFSPTFVVH